VSRDEPASIDPDTAQGRIAELRAFESASTGEWVGIGAVAETDAGAIASQVLGGNSRGLYRSRPVIAAPAG